MSQLEWGHEGRILLDHYCTGSPHQAGILRGSQFAYSPHQGGILRGQ